MPFLQIYLFWGTIFSSEQQLELNSVKQRMLLGKSNFNHIPLQKTSKKKLFKKIPPEKVSKNTKNAIKNFLTNRKKCKSHIDETSDIPENINLSPSNITKNIFFQECVNSSSIESSSDENFIQKIMEKYEILSEINTFVVNKKEIFPEINILKNEEDYKLENINPINFDLLN